MEKLVLCIDCDKEKNGKYFKNLEEFQKEHNKISFRINGIKHENFFLEGNTLSYISNLYSNFSEIRNLIIEQKNEINAIKNKLNFYEDSLKNDVYFETKINIKYIENKIFGKCMIHFFPKSIHFRIECQDDLIFSERKEFEIEILFPFKESKIKYSSIEKLQGCLFGQKVLNISEQETIIYNNYSSSINQKNKLTSIKLLRNFSSFGLLEKKKIDICISGMLTFSDFGFNSNNPCILYNIEYQKFIYYKDFKWKFIENCFSEDGNVKNECIINLELDYKKNEIYIKNQFNSYLKNENNNNFLTQDKNEGKFQVEIFNEFYFIIKIKIKNSYLSPDNDTDMVKLSNEEKYFIAYNI